MHDKQLLIKLFSKHTKKVTIPQYITNTLSEKYPEFMLTAKLCGTISFIMDIEFKERVIRCEPITYPRDKQFYTLISNTYTYLKNK